MYQNSCYNGSSEFVIYYFYTPKIAQESLSYIFLPVTQRHPQPYSPLDVTPSYPSLRSPLSLQTGCFPLLPLPSLPSSSTMQDSPGSCSWPPIPMAYLPPSSSICLCPLVPTPPQRAFSGQLFKDPPPHRHPQPTPTDPGTQAPRSRLRSAVPELRRSYGGAQRIVGTQPTV